jgi:protein phosphatase
LECIATSALASRALDVHGCADELKTLLGRLGYAVVREEIDGEPRYSVRPPEGRKAVFLGDLVDRGPRVADSLRVAMDMVADGHALTILGNHEAKVEKWLKAKNVGLARRSRRRRRATAA